MQKARFAFARQAFFGRAHPSKRGVGCRLGHYRHMVRCLLTTFAMLSIADDSKRIIRARVRVRN